MSEAELAPSPQSVFLFTHRQVTRTKQAKVGPSRQAVKTGRTARMAGNTLGDRHLQRLYLV